MGLLDYNIEPETKRKNLLPATPSVVNPNQGLIDSGKAIALERAGGSKALLHGLTDNDYIEMERARAKKEEHGFVGEVAAGLGRGALRVAATPAYLADVAGEAVGWKGLERAGEWGAEKVEKFIEESPRLRKSASISGDIRDNPQLWTDPKWYASIVSEGAPTIASMFIPGMAAARAARAAGMGAKAVQAARMGGALAAGMGLEAGGAAEDIRQYEKRTGEKVPISTKLKTVTGTGVIAGSLEAIPVFNIFGSKVAKKLIGRIITSMALEGGTEGAQEIVANAFAKVGYDADRDMVGGVIESVVGGVLLGGGMGAMQQTFQERIQNTDSDKVADLLEQAEKEITTEQQTVTIFNNMLDEGMATGEITTEIDGVTTKEAFTPETAIEVIRQAYADEILTDENIDQFKEKYPALQSGLNEIIGDNVAGKINQEMEDAEKIRRKTEEASAKERADREAEERIRVRDAEIDRVGAEKKKAEEAVKPRHEMTLDEFVEETRKFEIESGMSLEKAEESITRETERDSHKRRMLYALEQGEKIPRETLLEYSDDPRFAKALAETKPKKREPLKEKPYTGNIKFIGMQKVLDKPSVPLFATPEGGSIEYDSAKHKITNLAEYEKAVAVEPVIPKSAEAKPSEVAEKEIKGEGIVEVAPKKPIKPIPSKIRTLRGAIKELGGIDFLNYTGELKDLDVSTKRTISKKGALGIDRAVNELMADGWLDKNTTVASFLEELRTNPKAMLSRDRTTADITTKKPHELSAEEKRLKEEMEYEPEAPPEGEYVTLNAEDLPAGKELTLIEGKTARGWDLYEVTAKDEFSITLKDGKEITLSPFDKVQVLKKDVKKTEDIEIISPDGTYVNREKVKAIEKDGLKATYYGTYRKDGAFKAWKTAAEIDKIKKAEGKVGLDLKQEYYGKQAKVEPVDKMKQRGLGLEVEDKTQPGLFEKPAEVRDEKKFATKEDYVGTHEAPDRDYGSPLNNLSGFYPDDIYGLQGARYYGHGGDYIAVDRQTISIIRHYRNKPNLNVTIYRAIPKAITAQEKINDLEKQKRYILKRGKIPSGVETYLDSSEYYNKISEEIDSLKAKKEAEEKRPTINAGDWVTINKRYAIDHGRREFGRYRIVQKTVKASEVFTDGGSIHEWGYDPKISDKRLATKATKPQETITRKDLREIFTRMKNVVTGQDLKGNFFFRVAGRPRVTIYTVNEIEGYIDTSSGRIPVGSFLHNKMELKTGGVGPTADVITLWHEFNHGLEDNHIISGNDVKVLSEAVAKDLGINVGAVTSHQRGDYIGKIIVDWKTQANTRIKRILKKISDFMDTVWEFVSRTRTAEGVIRDIESGKILAGKKEIVEPIRTTVPAFQTKPTPEYEEMLKRYQKAGVRKPSFQETLEPVTEEDFIANRKDSRNIKLAAATNIKRVASEIVGGVDRFLGSISTRLGQVSPKLKAKMRKLDFDINTKYAKDVKVVQPLLEKAKKMNRDDFADWDYARKNSNIAKIGELINKYGLQDEYIAYRKTLDSLREEGLDVGMEIGEIEEYAPRILKDDRGFLKEIGKPEYRPLYSDKLKARAEEMGITVESMPHDLKADIVSNIILGGWVGLGGIPATKHRVLRKIPANLNKFYMNSDAALMQHLHSMRKGIEARKFFGKIPKKVAEMRKRLYAVQAQIRELNDQLKNELPKEESEKFRKRRNKHIGLEKQYTAYIQTYAIQRDYKENIGAYVIELIEKKEISAQHERVVNDILKARFHEVGTRGVIQAYKNLSYIDTMGSPISALTQIGDLAWAAYEGGLIRTLKYAYKATVKKSRITKEDVGVERIAQEFADPGTLGNAVSKIFKIVGLEKIDSIGKEALLNTALEKYQTRAKKEPLKLKREIRPIFEAETDSVIDDLINNEISDNVKLLTYSRLLDFQPVGLSEMPQGYLDAGNGRLFYMLKTFTIKVFDVFRNESYNKIRYGVKADKIQGFKNLVRLSVFFVLANAGADELKDFVLGRKTDFSDRLVDNVLRLFGVSKFVTWKARTEGVGSALARQILPPFKFVDSAGKDIITAGDEKGLEVIGSIPVVGKLAYWHIGRGTSKREDLWDRRLRKHKAKLKTISNDLAKSKNKPAFRREHRAELFEYERINKLQGRLNSYRKRINQIKSRKETKEGNLSIQNLEKIRTEMIKQFLKKE